MTLKETVDKCNNFLLELFFPRFCFGCRKEGSYLCSDCRSTLEISEYTYCLCNQGPLRVPPNENKGRFKGKCSRCKDKKLSGLYFALPYKEKSLTRVLIHRFKYEPYYIKDLAGTLAGVIAEHLVITKNNTEEIWQNAVLVPVPLGKKRLKIRGYNQSEELAKGLSKIIKVPVLSDVLTKIRPTQPQMKLSAQERKDNLKNVFAVKNSDQVRGKKVFLVDDVYTTGATMEECARVLKENGVKSVWGMAIAREG